MEIQIDPISKHHAMGELTTVEYDLGLTLRRFRVRIPTLAQFILSETSSCSPPFHQLNDSIGS
jgi:hypothetical protein